MNKGLKILWVVTVVLLLMGMFIAMCCDVNTNPLMERIATACVVSGFFGYVLYLIFRQ
jgi:hypothetical protein